MANNDNKYLTLARRAREEGNVEDARKFYDTVRTDDPDHVEARFFYAYYRLWDGTKGEAYNDFIKFCNATKSIVEAVADSDAETEDKVKLLADMQSCIKGLPAAMSSIQIELWKVASDSEKTKYNNQKKHCENMGIQCLYRLGDAIEDCFADNAEAQKIAVAAWKSGVAVQQQYPYCGIDKSLPEKYLPKIQKADPDYTLPKKAGCISFGK